MDKLPIFPTIQQVDNPREWFNGDQYTLLVKTLDSEIAKNIKVRLIPLTIHMRYLVEFAVNSFLRVPDLKTLKHGQIEVKGDAVKYLRIMAFLKVKPSPVVTMPEAAVIYAKLAGREPPPDQYVFFPEYENRDYVRCRR